MTPCNPSFFAILSPARCRSSYLHSLLHSHPDVICHSELFHQNRPILYLKELASHHVLYDKTWRDEHPHSYIEQLIVETQRYRPHAKLIGCKLLLYAYQMNRGLDAVLDLKPRTILLSRKNKLAWYSSLKIALETGIWSLEEKSHAAQHTISFNATEFHDMLEMTNLCEKITLKELERRRIPFLTVEHDELNDHATVQKILHFLNLPETNLLPRLFAQNTPHILKRFKNQADVISFAASTGKLAWIDQTR